MIIPSDEIEPSVLKAIIEQYVLREGTEYGSRDYSLEEKVARVEAQIKKGDVIIMWSETHETVNLVSKADLNWSEDG